MEGWFSLAHIDCSQPYFLVFLFSNSNNTTLFILDQLELVRLLAYTASVSIAEHADRIARELDASAKRKT